MSIRGLAAALNANDLYETPEHFVDHLVIGGGVVGLAIAERLSKVYPHKSTYLVERHAKAGEEISSRNSEVIHAGIYYPPRSLKTQLCIRGRRLLYQRCLDHGIPYRRVGKLIVASDHQRHYLHHMIENIKSIPVFDQEEPFVPVHLLSGSEAREMEPDLSPDIALALHSPQTGILDSHALIQSFEKEIEDSQGGEIVYSTRVVRVDPYSLGKLPANESADGTLEGWVVQTLTSLAEDPEDNCEGDSILSRVLINASGLNANLVLNSLLPRNRAIPMHYAKGSYASYHGPGVGHISKLIYPVPHANGTAAPESFKFQSLGTHLTLDMNGGVRFGPDIEWLSPPSSSGDFDGPILFDPDAIDFWKQHLAADEDNPKMIQMHRVIAEYLPAVTIDGLRPDYVGIRPKLVGPAGGFQDFQLRVDRASDFGGSGDVPMISLLGIESPGLTASLALAELVVDLLKP